MMPAIPSTIAAPASFLNLGVLFFLRRLIFYRLIEEEEAHGKDLYDARDAVMLSFTGGTPLLNIK
jgi:hypothetical protein